MFHGSNILTVEFDQQIPLYSGSEIKKSLLWQITVDFSPKEIFNV